LVGSVLFSCLFVLLVVITTLEFLCCWKGFAGVALGTLALLVGGVHWCWKFWKTVVVGLVLWPVWWEALSGDVSLRRHERLPKAGPGVKVDSCGGGALVHPAQ
jgi:hypothetical protein